VSQRRGSKAAAAPSICAPDVWCQSTRAIDHPQSRSGSALPRHYNCDLNTIPLGTWMVWPISRSALRP